MPRRSGSCASAFPKFGKTIVPNVGLLCASCCAVAGSESVALNTAMRVSPSAGRILQYITIVDFAYRMTVRCLTRAREAVSARKLRDVSFFSVPQPKRHPLGRAIGSLVAAIHRHVEEACDCHFTLRSCSRPPESLWGKLPTLRSATLTAL